MSEKCFCHLNGYQVKDANARKRLDEIEKDHGANTNFVLGVGGLAENPENNGKVLGIQNEQIVAMDAPAGGGLPEVTAADKGKFLRVSAEGKWAAEALQDVSKEGM